MTAQSREGRFRFLGALVFAALQPWSIGYASDRDQSPQYRDGIQVVCAPDVPVAHPGESVTVRAWAIDANGIYFPATERFSWRASSGTIFGGEIATWLFESEYGNEIGYRSETAEVMVRLESQRLISCKLTVTLIGRKQVRYHSYSGGVVRGVQLLSGRSFLVPGANEDSGYGLYSYLLFESPPTDTTERARYLGAIESYLRVIQSIAEMERYRHRSQINLVILPVKRSVALPDNLSDTTNLAKSAEEVLAVYDYARSQSLLAELGPKGVRTGPYLISIMPLGSQGGKMVLRFDMSRVVPSLVSYGVRTFCALASQEGEWSEIKFERIAFELRNILAVATRDVPDVGSALRGWIHMVTLR